jgi:Uma2 family endonuclease
LRPHHVEGAPDLIIEIVSPESEARDWREKYLEYQAAGVREYWVIDPMSGYLEAYALRQKRYRLIVEKSGKIHSTVLKGFYIRPAWLFGKKLSKVARALRELRVRV